MSDHSNKTSVPEASYLSVKSRQTTLWGSWVLLGLIFLIALSLRLPEFGTAGLWNDEAIVAAVAEYPFPKLLEKVTQDAHPPLFFVIERFVRLGLGFDGWNEAGVRLMPLVFGMISIIVIYLVGRQLISNRVGLMASFLLAVNPMHIHYCREGRNYTLLMLLILLAISCVVAMHRRPNIRIGFLTALVFIALVYTHSISLFFLAPAGVMLFISMLRRGDKESLKALGTTIGVSFLGLLPWLPILFNQSAQISNTASSGSGPIEWVQPYWDKLFPFQVPASLGAMSHGSMPPVNNFVSELWWTAWLALGVSALLIVVGWRYRSSWREPWAGSFLLTTGLGSLFLIFLASWIGTPVYTPGRVDTIALPTFILLLASWIQVTANDSGQELGFKWLNSIGFGTHDKGSLQKVLWVLIPVIALTTLAVKPIQHEIDAVRGTQNRDWIRYFSRYTADGDIFMVTGKWWTTLEYYLPRFDKDLHLVGFPSGRELHPNWLDWSAYDGDKLKEDADQVAQKVAKMAEEEGSTVWVYPGRASAGIGIYEMDVFLLALSKYMTPVTFEKHPHIRNVPYPAFRPDESVERPAISIEKIIKTAELHPDSFRHQYKAARTLQQADRHLESIIYFERIIDDDPDYKLTSFWLGFAYQKTGQSGKAVEQYQHFLKERPEHVQSHFNLAYALMVLQDCQDAISHFNTVLELKPSYNEVHLHLSRCYKKLGNAKQSKKHLEIWQKKERK